MLWIRQTIAKGGFFGYKLLGLSIIKEDIPLPEERGMMGQEEATAQAGVNDGECELRKRQRLNTDPCWSGT